MNTDSELLSAVRESFAGARLTTPLEATIRRGRQLRSRRRRAGITGAAVVVGGAVLTAAALAPGAGRPSAPASNAPPARSAAWTVTKGPHGTVTVLIRQLRDPAGLERALRADGVPATVAFQGGMLSDTPPVPRDCHAPPMSDEAGAHLQEKILGPAFPDPGRRDIALIIHGNQIPDGIGLNLTVQTSGSGWGWSLGLVEATPQCTGS